MVKRVSLDDADNKVKEFLKRLKTEENQYILEIGGKPLVGVVSARQIEETKQVKRELLAMLKEVWAKTKKVPEEEIEKEVEEAIKAVRRSP